MKKILYIALALLTLHPAVSSGVSLLGGILFALVFSNPLIERTKILSTRFLSLAVMGLGAGTNLLIVGEVGLRGVSYTLIGITFTFLAGLILEKILRTDSETSLLISVGTAICGGSAIAAVSPVLNAKSFVVSAALGTVFILNALALFIFPAIGHYFGLSETQFGLWSALAVHDTSSVVGTSLQYGPKALEIGTMIKLSRALWIIPVALVIGLVKKRGEKTTAKKPWFILGFIVIAALVTYFPELSRAAELVEYSAKRLMVLTLFLIGSNLSIETLKLVGLKPLVYGFTLWLIVASTTLVCILQGLISF